MRTPLQLADVPVNEWTAEEAFAHLTSTFEDNCRQYPDVMERYMVLMADAADAADDEARTEIMRRGLRETINERHPPKLRALIKAGMA